MEEIRGQFNDSGYIEGELEVLFAKCIVNYRDNKKLEAFNDILKKFKELEKDKKHNIHKKEKFLILFKNKVKYKYMKYKISKKIIDTDDLSEMEIW